MQSARCSLEFSPAEAARLMTHRSKNNFQLPKSELDIDARIEISTTAIPVYYWNYWSSLMAPEIKGEVKLEIVHVLFLDIVGYSKRLTDEQQALIDQLNQVVRGSATFQKAEAADRLIKIPTGDGMALIFYNSPEQPVNCALEVSRALKNS